MNQADTTEAEHGGTSIRTVEAGVALAIMALAALVMLDSWRIGAQWASDGPQAGYFPFYVGLMMFACSAVVLLQAFVQKKPRRRFAEPEQFKAILALLAPTVVYVGVVYAIGIYIGSAIYLCYFMRVLGKYRWQVIAPVAFGVPAILFLLFEVWFLVPLPKGPVEDFFGF